MAALAVICMGWHFGLGWTAFQQEAAAHDEAAVIGDYLIEWGRDTFENLQSEFWQLAVQFLVLAGVLKMIGLQTYEEDTEQVKADVAEIKKTIAGYKTDLYKIGYEMQERNRGRR